MGVGPGTKHNARCSGSAILSPIQREYLGRDLSTNPYPPLLYLGTLGIAVASRRPLWPSMTKPRTVPTPQGPVAMVPGRRGSGSPSGPRVSSVSGRI